MKKSKRVFIVKALFASMLFILAEPTFSEISFNGLAGARIGFSSDPAESEFSPQLKIDSFFAGQMNLSENLFLHGEFTLKTPDLIKNSAFEEIDAKFRIDELSLILRSNYLGPTNYFSVFIGTYESIGSDIFLRRHFGIQPIASKLTESWLGTAGSIIYPLSGAGISDVMHFASQPGALGFYAYVNHELDDSYVLNFDGRLAFAYKYLKLDISTGIGSPLNTEYYDDAYVVITKLYWRIGGNLLAGNPHSFSVYIQAGASEIPFSKSNTKISFSGINTYFLFEPRLNFSRFSIDLSAYSFPEETAEELLFVENTLGTSLNFYTDDFYIRNQPFVFGLNSSLSFPGKSLTDIKDIGSFFKDEFDICVAPYMQTKFLNGSLNAMVKINVMDIVEKKWHKGFGISLGYRTQF